jgi:hypothetical protein
MKIIKKLLPILLILGFLLTPFTSAFAYTGGLLDSQFINRGSDIDVSDVTTKAPTDNNETSQYTLLARDTNGDTFWYKFSSPVTLTDYKALSSNSSGLQMKFYRADKSVITQIGVANNVKTTMVYATGSNVENVTYVSLVNTTGSSINVYEFDVFGSSTPVSGLLKGKSPLSSADTSLGSLSAPTDGSNASSIRLTNNSNGFIRYDLGSLKNINKITFHTWGFMNVDLNDSTGNVITTKPVGSSNSTATNSSITFTTVPNVRYVTLKKYGAESFVDIVEIDVFEDTSFIPPPVKIDLTNVNVSGITKTEASVSWSKPTGYSGVTLNGFKIYVDGVLKDTASPSSTSYSLTGLTADTSYTVKVVASYSDGTETTGVTKVFNTLVPEDETAPGNVTNLVATPNFNSISLSWTNPIDQDFAKVNVYEDGVYKKSVTATEGSSAYFSNLDPDTTYSFKVTSVDFTGNESSGAVIEVKTLPLPEVKKIKNLSATTKFDRVKLSWTLPESEHFHHVNIYRKIVEEKSFFESLFSLGTITVSAADTEDEYKPMFETNGTYWTDLTVEPETKYEYKLTSENVDGRESEEGVVVQVSTPEEPKPVLKDAQFQQATNGDYIIGWSEPTTGNVKIKVGGKDYKTVPANLKTYTIPKTDLAYTAIGDPDVTIRPVTARGTEGDVVSNPKINLPFSVNDLIESGNGLLWLIGPFILLALAFLLVPKLRNLIITAFRGNKNTMESNRQRFQAEEKASKDNLKEERVQTPREPRQPKMPRIKPERTEREVRATRETRQSTREPREPRRRRGS